MVTIMRESYEALRQTAGVAHRDGRGLIAVTGPDRSPYLQGLLTNDIVALQEGDQCYAAHLTPQGRLIADMQVLCLPDVLLLDVPGECKDSLVAKFQEVVFTEEVEIVDRTDGWMSLGVTGPVAPTRLSEALQRIGIAAGDVTFVTSNDRQVGSCSSPRGDVIVARTDALGTLGFDVWAERPVSSAFRTALVSVGCVEVDSAAVETVRIENGRPLFPVDMDDTTIPLEAGIEDRAISFDKGCYVGQEVIIRIMHRGQGRVAKKLVGLRVDGSDSTGGPHVGAGLLNGDIEVGRVTSVAWSPLCEQVVALAYVVREQAQPGTALEFETATGRRRATVSELPFVAA